MAENNARSGVIEVFVVDDHELMRVGIRSLLHAQPDIRVIGEAGTAATALDRILAVRPDVAILGVRLPDGNGVNVCREIRSQSPEVACLMLASFEDDPAIINAVTAGAAGYVPKRIRGTDLAEAVRTIASGQSV
jgi:two-component system, NarL family, response regulator DevR